MRREDKKRKREMKRFWMHTETPIMTPPTP
jgi:hypothetical protein